MATLLNPTEERDRLLIDVDLGDDKFVKARRLDLSEMLLEGEIPLTLVIAARQLIEQSEADPEEALSSIKREEVLRELRRHAVVVVVDPVVTAQDDHDPTHMPVQLFKLPQLLAIWNQTAVLPKVGAAAAAEFRHRAGVSPLAVIPPREDIRSSPKLVAPLEYRGA